MLSAQTFEILYKKLDSLYLLENFSGCLNLEPAIVPLIGARQDTLVANTLFYIGDSYRNDFKIEVALTYFLRERDLRKSLLPVDPEGYSNSLYNLMHTYDQEGNVRAAVEAGRAIIEFDEQYYGVESEQYVYSMGDFVDLLLQIDRWQAAEQILKEGGSKISKSSRFSGLVEAKLGYVYTYTGLFGKATNCFTNSIPAIEQHYGETSKEYQLTLANYGALLMEQGKYDRAEEVLAEVIKVMENSDWEEKDLLTANAHNNISLTYQALGQYEQAESSFEGVLRQDSATIGISHPDFAITLSNLGQLYTQEGKYENSETVLLKAIEILRVNEEGNTLSYAIKLNNLAKNYIAWNQPARAIELLQEALKIIENELGKKAPEYATVLFNLGAANLSINPSLGYAYLKKSELARRRVLGKRHPLYAETLEKLSQYQWKQRNKKEVNKLLKLVFENYYNQVEDFFPVLTEEEKSNLYYNKIRPSQEYFASWVCDKSVIDAEEVGELYNIALNTKGLILFASNKVRHSILESGDKTLIELYQRWEDEKELLAFYISRNSDSQKTDSLLNSSKILEKELSRRSAVFSREIIRPKQTWQKVQAILKPGEVAMEVIRFRDFNIDSLNFTRQIKYAFLLLTSEMKNGPQLLVLDNGELLENRYLSYYRNGVRLKLDDAYSFDNYWKKIHEELVSLKCQTLFLSADGVYNLISIESIKNPTANRYIIEDLDIKNVTSTRELLSMRTNNKIGQNNLLIGYPTYQLAVKEGLDANPFSVNRLSKTTRGALSRLVRSEAGITELPATKVEVEKIHAALSEHHSSKVLLANEANEWNIKAIKNPSILHLATHGFFFENESEKKVHSMNALLNSGLILAGATNFIRDGINPIHEEEDGILTTYEVMNLNLDSTNLVVLSACETGLGVVQNGEGVYGLQRAFQLAGAKNIIMSLWPVDDEATQSLMTTFYKQWVLSGDLNRAFRQAKLEAINKYPNPYYWGAFILVGN